MEEQMTDALKRLMGLKLEITIGEGAPQSDRELERILREGETEENLDKIYQFVEACERGQRLINTEVASWLEEGFQESPESVMQILSGKMHLERCILLASGSEEMRIGFVEMGAAENMCFLYECLRQLLLYGTSNDKIWEVLAAGIVKLSNGCGELWQRWIRTFELNRKWTALLGKVLPELEEQALFVYVQTIGLRMPEEKTEEISWALHQMDNEKLEMFYSSVASIVYQRWKDYLWQLREEKYGCHGIVISGYAELIFNSVLHLFDTQDKWEQEVSETLVLFMRAQVEWYTGITQMKTVFYIYMSQLYLLFAVGTTQGFVPGETVRAIFECAKRQMETQEYLWEDERQRDVLYQRMDELLMVP